MAVYERNEKNAPGPFYVVKDECLRCCAPQAEAPALISGCAGDDGCYFRKQPESPEEIDAAIGALMVSCIEILRYGGHDDEIRTRLAEVGMAQVCDHPLANIQEVVRDHVRFAWPHPAGARSLAKLLVRRLLAFHGKDARCRSAPAGDASTASFELTPSLQHIQPARYLLTRLADDRWLLVAGNSRFSLREILREDEATDFRWYSKAEWAAGSAGKPKPY